MRAAPFAPAASAPLRCTLRPHFANTEIQLHSHPWIQMVFSSRGVVRVSTDRATYSVPPWRAIWIPPGTPHTAIVLEDAQLHSLHLLSPENQDECEYPELLEGKRNDCRVIEVKPLLRELVRALAEEDTARKTSKRYRSLCTLTLLEIRRAPTLLLGIALPSERRLRAFCELFLNAPRLDQSPSQLAREVGASPSTINRLFHIELGSTFSEWRKQVLLAQALALAAKGMPMGQIALENCFAALANTNSHAQTRDIYYKWSFSPARSNLE